MKPKRTNNRDVFYPKEVYLSFNKSALISLIILLDN